MLVEGAEGTLDDLAPKRAFREAFATSAWFVSGNNLEAEVAEFANVDAVVQIGEHLAEQRAPAAEVSGDVD